MIIGCICPQLITAINMIHFIIISSGNCRDRDNLPSFITKEALCRLCSCCCARWPLSLAICALIFKGVKYCCKEEHKAIILPSDLVDLGREEKDILVREIHRNQSKLPTRLSAVVMTLISLNSKPDFPALSRSFACFSSL